MRFFNRVKEVRFYRRLIEGEPNSLSFVFGPKSCGKSALLKETLRQMKEDLGDKFQSKFSVYWFDLRGVLVSSCEDFLDVLIAPAPVKEKSDSSAQGLVKAQGGIRRQFTISEEIFPRLKKGDINPFRYLHDQLSRNAHFGRRNILVFDELQVIKNVYLSENSRTRLLVDELFNLFVTLSKVEHVAHVIITSSDAFFVEKVYKNSQLERCARSFLVDHLGKEETLSILEKEGFTSDDMIQIWNTVGGDLWSIAEIMCARDGGIPVSTVLSELERSSSGKLRHSLFALSAENSALYADVIETLKGFIFLEKVPLGASFLKWEGVKWLVGEDILFYDPLDAVLKPNSRLTLNSMRTSLF